MHFFFINRARLFLQCIVAMITCCNHLALLIYRAPRGFLVLVRPPPHLFHFRCGDLATILCHFSSRRNWGPFEHMLVRIHCSYGSLSSDADATTSSILPNAQQPVDKWTSLQSFDKNQSYSAPVQMYVSTIILFISLASCYFLPPIDDRVVWWKSLI